MKKILSLVLVLLMVLTVFCSCKDEPPVETDIGTGTPGGAESESGADSETDKKEPWKPGDTPSEGGDTPGEGDGPAIELAAPLTAPNGKTMELVSVMDGTWTKPFDAEASAWVSESTDKVLSIFDNNGTVNLNEYSGFLVRVKPNEVNNGIYLRFFLKMQDGTELEIKALGRILNWYTVENGWTTITAGETASNWKLPIGEEGYAYLEFPLNEVAAHSTSVVTDIKIGSYATSRSATFSEWTLVKGASTLTKPTTLADNTKIELVPITDGTFTKDAAASDSCWATATQGATTNIFANGATVDLTQYKGFLVKKTPNNEGGGIYIRFKFKMADGTEIEMKAKNRELGWYTGTWGTATTAESNWKFPLDEEGYAFLPFPVAEVAEKGSVISDICVYSSSTNRSAIFSEWYFVKAVDGSGSGETPEEPPVVKPELPALSAPTTLPDGTAITLKPITDGWFTKDPGASAGCWATSTTGATTSIFKDGATIDLSNYKGFMVRKAPNTEGGGIYIRFKFKVVKADGTTEDVEIKADGRNLYFYSENAWNTIASAEGASNWKVVPIDKDGYIYIEFPFKEMEATGTVVSDIYIYSSSGSRSAIFTDWCLVSDTIAAPTTLPDGSAITATQITDGVFEVASENNLSAWSTEFANSTANVFANGASVNLSEYKGILIKATTYAEKNYAGIRFHFKFKLANGETITVKSAKRPYQWYNGETWTEVAGAASNWTTPEKVEAGYIYVAFPFSELTSTEVVDIGIVSQSGKNRFGNYSDFCLVK